MNELINTPVPSASDEKIHALLAHLLGIPFGFIPSLIFWLLNKDDPERAFVTDQAKEALNFQLNVLAVWMIGIILTLIFIGIFIIMAVAISSLVFSILAGIAAYEGKAYRYPSFIIRLIK